MKTRKRHGSLIYRFVWVAAKDVMEIPKKKRLLYKATVAICEHSGRVAKLAGSILDVLIISDMYHTDGACEEASRCLDFDCPLNKTTWASWKAAGMTAPRARKFERFGERLSFNNGPDGLNDFSFVFKKEVSP